MNYVWYKNAIFYSLDVETFYDANGDGIGDFEGLILRLDYLAGLGINCLWLLPFYPTPNRDNGYDVMDYCNVDPRLGTLGDFAEFMDKAQQLGIRVIIDFIVNHTSIHHPWFQEARKDPASKYHDYYVWRDEPLALNGERIMFSGEENAVWTFDEAAGKYYLHRFYKEQPDLNIGNPAVRTEILKILGFWLQLGVSGFRIDAAEMLIESYGIQGSEKSDFSDFLTEMRQFLGFRESNAILIAETNILPEEIDKFIDSGRRMQMLFIFYLNQHLFLALAQEKGSTLYEALRKLPQKDAETQWLNFLRHHDELSLELLDQREQAEIHQAFAPAPEMRIFGAGVRRRLAPMLNQERARLELAFSLLFSLPGAPLIRYGDEIGMGENLSYPGRLSVRTPMQWSEAPEAGFSESGKNAVCPVISEGDFGFKKVNVRKQLRDPFSFLTWIGRLIAARKQFAEIGRGTMELFPTAESTLFAHKFVHGPAVAYFFHNLSQRRISVPLNSLQLDRRLLYELFGDTRSPELSEMLILEPFGYKWLRQAASRD